MPVPVNKDKDEMIKMAIAMSLEGQSRVNENEHEENVGKSYCNVKWRVRRKCWQMLMLVSWGQKAA